MSARLLLLGAGGQVGQAFLAAAKPADWTIKAVTRRELDITDPAALRFGFHDFSPDLVLNAAGFTAVDLAEQDDEPAMAANFRAPAHLAALCSMADVPLIHLSTDFVFDGEALAPYAPNAPMNPVNRYGQSKMMGEEAIRSELAWHVILRVSSVLSAYGANILTKTLDLIDKHDELRMVADQTSAPTPATDLADALVTIAKGVLHGTAGGYGTFHYCGTPACSRYELTQRVMELYAPHTTRRPTITPTGSDSFPLLAKRPPFSVLDCAKTEAIFGISQKPWQAGLDQAMNVLIQQKKAGIAS